MAPGDALVFAAPRVLHRGWLPAHEPRDVLLFVLQPSFTPWHHELEDFGIDHLFLDHTKNTLHTNPFEMFHPNVKAEQSDKVPFIDGWVVLGDLMPAEL